MAGYGDDTGLDTWLAANGYTWPAAITKAVGRQRGSAYIDGVYGSRFPGTRTGGYAQERAWPRTDAQTADGEDIASDEVPTAVVEASYAAAYYEASNPGALAVAVTAAGAVKRKEVASLKIEYFEGKGGAVSNATPVLAAVEGLLAPFLVAADFPYPLVV